MLKKLRKFLSILKKFFQYKKDQHEHKYDLSFDNLAIPEIHTHKLKRHKKEKSKYIPIKYDNVAIPEIHIRNKKKDD